VNQYIAAKTIIAVFVLPALVISALWFPFGFSLGGLIEEWDILFLFARHGLFFIADQSSPLALHHARPLTILPQAVAYLLDPNSFLYWHIMQGISLLLKGMSAGLIGFYLTGNRAHAAFLGLLTILYPADTMQLSFRSLHINWAIALALIASILLIRVIHIESRSTRTALAAFASGLFACALLMYEVVIGLAALPFLIMFARLGRKVFGVLRPALDAVIVWACTIGAWSIFFIWEIRTGSGYQVAALSDEHFGSILARLNLLASSGLYRAFYECWTELFGGVLGSLSDYRYVACVLSGILIAILWLGYDQSARRSTSAPLGIRISIVGLCAFLLGYAPYLSDQSHLLLTQRVFLVGAVGAALSLLGCIVLLATILPRLVVTTVSVLLIGGCFVSQLYQFDKYNRIYATITRPLLSAIVPFISESTSHQESVLINDYGFLSGTWDLGLELQLALGYLVPTARADHIFICEAISGRLLPRASGPVAQRGSCEQTKTSFRVAEPGDTPVALRDPAIGKLDPDGTVMTNAGERDLSESLPTRASQLFSLSKWEPADSMFRAPERLDSFECRFESMWGYAVPCRTFGFYDGLPYATRIDSAYAWIGEHRSGLIFNIDPTQQTYQIVIETLDRVSPSLRFKIKLNGADLLDSSTNLPRIEASFASSLLRRKNNVLEFDTELNKESGLSFALKAISVRPFRAQPAPN
jgi:hypothetical protein